MDKVPLSDELKAAFYEFIETDPNITSLNTIKSYQSIGNRVFEKYDILDKRNTELMLRRYGKNTNIKHLLAKLNEFFIINEIDYTIRLRKGKRTPRRIPDILSKEELQKILNTMPTVYKMMISCIYNIGSGLRISELINLEWGDISWDQLSLDNPIIDVKIRKSKGGKDRVIPMPKESAIPLIEYADKVGCIGSSGLPEGKRIFDFGEDNWKKDLKLIDEREWEYQYIHHAHSWIVYNIFKKYFKFSNKKITPHSLRHSRATELLTVHKVPIEKIKDWLGHEDISTTMIYLHMGSEDDKKLMGGIGGV